jgi:hypothetical protein
MNATANNGNQLNTDRIQRTLEKGKAAGKAPEMVELKAGDNIRYQIPVCPILLPTMFFQLALLL